MVDIQAENSPASQESTEGDLITGSPKPVSHNGSIITLPLKDGSFYSRWHETSCRPVLLEFIQNRTMVEINFLTRSNQMLTNELFQYLKQRLAKETGRSMHFLDLRKPTIWDENELESQETSFDDHPTFIGVARSSPSSHSSLNSISSQVSDSCLNDVQQSAEMLLRGLRDGHEVLITLEKGKILSKLGRVKPEKIIRLKGDAKILQKAMNEMMAMLRGARTIMESIGFSEYLPTL